MASYSRLGARSPQQGAVPMGQSSNYATSASASSHGAYSQMYGHSAPQNNMSAASMGGREYGPYSPLNRRANNGAPSSEDDKSTGAGSSERLLNAKGGVAAGAFAGSAAKMDASDYRGLDADDFLVSTFPAWKLNSFVPA